MRTAIIGGGAAGFFLAVNLKEMCPQMEINIFERSSKVLAKVEISGGGRCNCTNTFADVRDLSAVYPRGHRLMKRLMKGFSQRDAYDWFERHGVRLTTQEDQCVFPQSQNSHTIINCFLSEARRKGVLVMTDHRITAVRQTPGGLLLEPLGELFDFVAVTTGGSPKAEGLQWLAALGQEIARPVPSLFTFRIDDERLHALMGTVVEHATVSIPSTKMRAEGPLLITHWGMSGPAVLKLSSYAARLLSQQAYKSPLSVNWLSSSDDDIRQHLLCLREQQPQKQLQTAGPLPSRLWSYLAVKCLGQRAHGPWASLNAKEINRLTDILANDTYQISGRSPFKDEFVTCGGVALSSVNPSTLESNIIPHLYFAGEVLDIDGVTGGFNFQAAWTTAHTVARAIYIVTSTLCLPAV